eukprot:m.253488 g.253488  ORF g.253488 m.253488 type:complete len:390 (-) comp22673_c3_seq4:35-1204(-)
MACRRSCACGGGGDKKESCELMHSNCNFSVHQSTFLSLSLRPTPPTHTHTIFLAQSDLSVTEEKFALVFSCSVSLGNQTYHLHALSLPVVVVVHGVQMPNAEATVLWDAGFAEIDRVPFELPAVVPWARLSFVLDRFFFHATHTPLPQHAAAYLAEKLGHDGAGGAGRADQACVSWQAFNKDVLPGRAFTFWQWFYGITEIIKKQLSGAWADGSVFGFVSRTQAIDMLASCATGTFLLRFSDSEVGGITVAWVSADEHGNPQVLNLQPWTARDFAIRALADRIHDLPELQYLYPNIPKDTAFSKYYKAQPTVTVSSGDYVQSDIATIIAGTAGLNMKQAAATTPQASAQSFQLPDLSCFASAGSADFMDGFQFDADVLDVSLPEDFTFP